MLNSLNTINYLGDVSHLVEALFSLDKMEYLSENDYKKIPGVV